MSKCEWVAAWKRSLTFDPFDTLAIIRSHSFWHWPWQTQNRSQIVPNRINPRIIPTLKYFCCFGWQEAKCSYCGVEPAACCVLLSICNVQVNCTCLPMTRHIIKSPAGMWSVPCRCDYGEVWKKCAHNQVWTQSVLFTELCSAECSGVLPQQLVQIRVVAAYGSLTACVSSFPFLGKKYARTVLVYVSLWWAWHAAVEIQPHW